VDLDAPLDAHTDVAHVRKLVDQNSSPMLRTWGLELVVRVKYFNHGLATGAIASREQACRIEVTRSLNRILTPAPIPSADGM
jgi:hypothetical protein